MSKHGDIHKGTKLDRASVSVLPGSIVCHDKETFRITQVLDFNSVLGINVESGRASVMPIAELKPFLGNKIRGAYADYDLEELGAEEWATAQKRYSIISPFLGLNRLSRGVVEEHAQAAGVDTVTIYRWLRRYKEQGEITALIPIKRGWNKGRLRIPEEVV